MRKTGVLTAAMLAALALPGTAWAQVQQADRVRILTMTGVTLTGLVAETTPDSLALTIGVGTPSWIRRSDIAHLERSTGRHRMFFRNMALTTLSGAGVGAMIGAITWKECVSNEFLGCLFHPETRGDAFLFGGTVGAVVLAPVGILVGIFAVYDRWEPVDLRSDRRSGFSVVPRFDRGVGLSASFSF